ncbi:BatD family protein [Marinomonas spartinae]|uniref:BatD family protein n=1 Tax=Marinomonas spartinae TaxID=1792290 RepID=UPI0018F25691|nr:BatD family protein [Marinomonas spartinae]MBJ7553181.1 protein BatD [Marinomonas spartinae]
MVMKQFYFFMFALSRKMYCALATLLITGLFSLALPAYADSVTASLDKNVVTENDIVQLTIRADFTNTGNGPDLTPLKKDFDIVSQSQSSQFSFNLGSNTAMSYWVISLMPKSVGTFTIPPIKIGQYASQPLTLTVKNAPELLDKNGNPPVMLKTQVSSDNPYLQQQVIFTMKLYTSVPLSNANISVPSNPDLIFEQLTDDQSEFKEINGTRYQVLTRKYLAFPQRSGQITIAPQTMQAMMQMGAGQRIVRIQSQPINLQVLPIPPSYTNDNWLPSEGVTINTKLEKPKDTVRVGDTVIWTINIDAKDALPEQIPQLTFNSTKAYKLYPEPATFSSQKNDNGIIGHQTIKIQVVPTQKGTIKLPDVSVTYWDTNKRIEKTVTQSTPELTVVPLPTSASATTNNGTQKPKALDNPLPPQSRSVAPISLTKLENDQANPSDDTPKPIHTQLVKEQNEVNWRLYGIIGLSILLTLLLLACLLLFWKKKKSKDDEANVPTLKEFAPLTSSDEKSAFESLIECCRQDNITELRSHLLEWARHRWGDEQIRSIEDIKRLAGSVTLTQLLMEAELMLYSNQATHQWQGNSLAEALEEYQTGQPKKTQASQLKTLYPNF